MLKQSKVVAQVFRRYLTTLLSTPWSWTQMMETKWYVHSARRSTSQGMRPSIMFEKSMMQKFKTGFKHQMSTCWMQLTVVLWCFIFCFVCIFHVTDTMQEEMQEEQEENAVTKELEAERAILAIRSLKAKFPISDKFLQSLFEVIRFSVDLRAICSPSKVRSVLSLDDPTTVTC